MGVGVWVVGKDDDDSCPSPLPRPRHPPPRYPRPIPSTTRTAVATTMMRNAHRMRITRYAYDAHFALPCGMRDTIGAMRIT